MPSIAMPFRAARPCPIPPPIPAGEAMLLTATLADWAGDYGRLADGRRCRLAASCPVEPQAGDRVLVAIEADIWVLAVLARSGTRAIHLAAPHVAIEAASARIAVTALETHGQRWDATHEDIQLTAGSLLASLGSVRAVAARLASWVRDAFAWRERSVRDVAEIETLRCGHFDVAARDLMTLSTETGVLTARGLVKIDGAQIVVG